MAQDRFIFPLCRFQAGHGADAKYAKVLPSWGMYDLLEMPEWAAKMLMMIYITGGFLLDFARWLLLSGRRELISRLPHVGWCAMRIGAFLDGHFWWFCMREFLYFALHIVPAATRHFSDCSAQYYFAFRFCHAACARRRRGIRHFPWWARARYARRFSFTPDSRAPPRRAHFAAWRQYTTSPHAAVSRRFCFAS